MFDNNFKLILIVPSIYNIREEDFIKIIRYEKFDMDWKYNKISWNFVKMKK